MILSKLKRFQEAIEIFDNGIRIDPKYLNTYNSKGI